MSGTDRLAMIRRAHEALRPFTDRPLNAAAKAVDAVLNTGHVCDNWACEHESHEEPGRAEKPTAEPSPGADYQTLYKALQVRCSQVADRLRCVSALPADHRAAMPPNYLDGLADTLDTPISTQDAAEILHLGDRP